MVFLEQLGFVHFGLCWDGMAWDVGDLTFGGEVWDLNRLIMMFDG